MRALRMELRSLLESKPTIVPLQHGSPLIDSGLGLG